MYLFNHYRHVEHNHLLKAKESLAAALFVDSENKDAIAEYDELKVINY